MTRGVPGWFTQQVNELDINLRQRDAAEAVIAESRAGGAKGPPEWATPESTARWLDELRESEAARERRLAEAWEDPPADAPATADAPSPRSPDRR